MGARVKAHIRVLQERTETELACQLERVAVLVNEVVNAGFARYSDLRCGCKSTECGWYRGVYPELVEGSASSQSG